MNLFNLEAIDEDKLSQLNYGNRFEIYENSRKSHSSWPTNGQNMTRYLLW